MKWIGQHIFNFAVRVRDKLYDASGSSGSPASSTVIDYSSSTTGYAKTLTTDGDKINWTNATFTHDQGSAANTWVITHNLNKHPSVTVIDSAGTVVIGNMEYNSSNQITLTFYSKAVLVEFAGKAYLN